MPYSWRVVIAAVLMIMSFLIVGFTETPGVQLIGVACSAFQGGIGEASCLALAAFYDTPRALTAWSSGTGFAGIFGYAWVFVLHFGFKLSRQATLSAACVLAAAWLLTFFFLLGDPVNVIGCPREILNGDAGPLNDDHAADMYAPLASSASSLNSSPAEVDHESMGDMCEEERGGTRCSKLLVLDGNPESRVVTMSARERLHFTLSLWPYMVPLMTVFFAEVSGAFENAWRGCFMRTPCGVQDPAASLLVFVCGLFGRRARANRVSCVLWSINPLPRGSSSMGASVDGTIAGIHSTASILSLFVRVYRGLLAVLTGRI